MVVIIRPFARSSSSFVAWRGVMGTTSAADFATFHCFGGRAGAVTGVASRVSSGVSVELVPLSVSIGVSVGFSGCCLSASLRSKRMEPIRPLRSR